VKVLVLAGGNSGERAVSLDSGAAIYEALGSLGHELHALDPANGQNLIGSDGQFRSEDDSAGDALANSQSDRFDPLMAALRTDFSDIDLVFIGLHGGGGEDGSIQNLLELTGVRFTGSGVSASVVAMNKALTKRIMASVDVPTPRWKLFRGGEGGSPDSWSGEITSEFGCPHIVKPNDGGSTLGLSKVEQASDTADALKLAAQYSNEILVEAFIAGRELTVSVLDGHAYPVVEIKPVSGLYDYEAKYTKGMSEYVAPAVVDPALAEQMRQAAVRLYSALGCAGLARVDFVLDSGDRFYALEINTLPGMTALSLAPMAAACEGIGFDQLVQMIIDSALRK
jgi:D-alanine-D-alanine ligase